MVDGCEASYTVKRRVEAARRREVCLGVNRLLFLCQLIAGCRGLIPVSAVSVTPVSEAVFHCLLSLSPRLQKPPFVIRHRKTGGIVLPK